MNRPKILLVSSDKYRRPAFANAFKNLGCQVLSTVLAQDALAALDGFKPDIVLADMNLEDMKSNEFLKKVDAHANRKNMSFIPYTKFIDYKLIDPNSLSKDVPQLSGQERENMEKALDVLKENIRLVPGEIIVWVKEALAKKNVPIPTLLNVASDILEEASK